MNLSFKGENTVFSVGDTGLLGDHEPVFRTRLLGLCTMHKDDDSEGPMSDTYSIDWSTEKMMRAIPLLTTVHLVPPGSYGFESKKAYVTDWLGQESLTEPPGEEPVATIAYFEAGGFGSEYHGGHATIEVSLKVSTAALKSTSVLMQALQNPLWSVVLDLDGIEFTTHESMREKWGVPTLTAFLKGETAAYASKYYLSFSRRDSSDLYPPRDKKGKKVLFPTDTLATIGETYRNWLR